MGIVRTIKSWLTRATGPLFLGKHEPTSPVREELGEFIKVARAARLLGRHGGFIDVECGDVATMFDKFQFVRAVDDHGYPAPGHLTRVQLDERIGLMREELGEFIEAARAQDIYGMADALIDLTYVAKGTGVKMGLPWSSLWDNVHECNMAKVVARTKRATQDLVKPAGWVAPVTVHIVNNAGYDHREWSNILSTHKEAFYGTPD